MLQFLGLLAAVGCRSESLQETPNVVVTNRGFVLPGNDLRLYESGEEGEWAKFPVDLPARIRLGIHPDTEVGVAERLLGRLAYFGRLENLESLRRPFFFARPRHPDPPNCWMLSYQLDEQRLVAASGKFANYRFSGHKRDSMITSGPLRWTTGASGSCRVSLDEVKAIYRTSKHVCREVGVLTRPDARWADVESVLKEFDDAYFTSVYATTGFPPFLDPGPPCGKSLPISTMLEDPDVR